MTTRIKQCFASLKAENRKALVTFITAGDPDLTISSAILSALPQAGADIIELGMPFSDPMADGPAIQLGNIRALKNGMTLRKTLQMVKDFRKQDADTPIILMGYYNPIYHMGVSEFLDSALDAGVDGLIIVDLPPEEDNELCHPCLTAGLNWIRLTTPTSDDARLTQILQHSSGFVYHVAVAGITGTNSADARDLDAKITQIRQHTDLPIAVGFGIKTASQVKETAQFADAVVVGSAILNQISEALEQNESQDEIVQKVSDFVNQLSSGLK